MRSCASFFSLLVFLLAPVDVGAQFVIGTQSAADTTQITTTASAEVLVPPDRATVFLEIDTKAEAAVDAAAANRQLRIAVIEALAQAGLSGVDVTLFGYAGGPHTVMGGRPPQDGEAPVPFNSKSGVRVVFSPVDRLDEVVAAALGAGAASIPVVFFEASAPDEARAEAISAAVSQARIQAEAMAEAAGGQLGDLITMHSMPDFSMVSEMSRFFSGSLMNRGVQLAPSNLTVKVVVQASWIFIPN